MTEAEEIYDTCKSRAAAKAQEAKVRKTWYLIGIILAAIIIIVMLCLLYLHLRNKTIQQENKFAINNNTDGKSVSQADEEIATDELLKEIKC